MVGKRLVAMRSPSSRSPEKCSRFQVVFFMLSGVVVVGGVIEMVGVLIAERRWVRSVCTKEVVCSVAPLTSSFHWVSNSCGIRIWKRIERVDL